MAKRDVVDGPALRESPQPRVGGTGNDVNATIGRLKNEIARLNHLTGEFRTITRREKYEFVSIQIGGLIQDVLKIQMPQLNKQSVRVRSLLPAVLPKLAVDADRIKQALLNLIKNALKPCRTAER